MSTASEHWQDLIAVADLEPEDATPVSFGKHRLAVYDTLDGIFVSDARCSHAGAELCDGYFDGRTIECPLHQGLFDARSGAALAAPATRPLRMIAARVADGTVQICTRAGVPQISTSPPQAVVISSHAQ